MIFKSEKYLYILFLALFFGGCIFQGFYSGYHNLTSEDKERVVDIYSYSDISNLTDLNSIYLIDPENLKLSLQEYDKNVIYVWNPLCSNSIHPSLVKAEAEEKGYKLWLISALFFQNIAEVDFGIPIYGIKESIEYKPVTRYLKSFVRKLGCENYDLESLIVFNNGSYRYSTDIYDIVR